MTNLNLILKNEIANSEIIQEINTDIVPIDIQQ